jgi:hypothetical protein
MFNISLQRTMNKVLKNHTTIIKNILICPNQRIIDWRYQKLELQSLNVLSTSNVKCKLHVPCKVNVQDYTMLNQNVC